jgi:hypothetical protein
VPVQFGLYEAITIVSQEISRNGLQRSAPHHGRVVNSGHRSHTMIIPLFLDSIIMSNPKVFFDVTMDGKAAGRIVFEVCFSFDPCPMSCSSDSSFFAT